MIGLISEVSFLSQDGAGSYVHSVEKLAQIDKANLGV